MNIIDTWHCEGICERTFYTDLGEHPENCPFCGSKQLANSKMLEVKELGSE